MLGRASSKALLGGDDGKNAGGHNENSGDAAGACANFCVRRCDDYADDAGNDQGLSRQ